jgi:hypothetical protein
MPKQKALTLETALAIGSEYMTGLSRRALMRKYPRVSERQIRKIMACICDDPLLSEMREYHRWQISFSRFLGTAKTDSVPPLRHDV